MAFPLGVLFGPQPLLGNVRAVAFQSTTGLARGVAVRATGGPIVVPVGKHVLGWLLDVVGNPQDDGPALTPDTPRRSIHALSPLLSPQTHTTDVFQTGIKVIDLLTPMEQGGKAALFGGAGKHNPFGGQKNDALTFNTDQSAGAGQTRQSLLTNSTL